MEHRIKMVEFVKKEGSAKQHQPGDYALKYDHEHIKNAIQQHVENHRPRLHNNTI